MRVKSDGHAMNVVDTSELLPDEAEFGHSTAMVRGVVAKIAGLGYKIGGFDCVTTSDVIGGSGLSSSAAFEVLLGTTLSYLYNDGVINSVEIAKTAQYSENVFFGKPCGLLDQMASSVGTFVTIDFESTENPKIKRLILIFQRAVTHFASLTQAEATAILLMIMRQCAAKWKALLRQWARMCSEK